MGEYAEVDSQKCGEVQNCMCVKEKDEKQYCLGCGNVQPEREENECENIV